MERDGGVQVWITEGRKGRSGNGAKQNPKKGLDDTKWEGNEDKIHRGRGRG